MLAATPLRLRRHAIPDAPGRARFNAETATPESDSDLVSDYLTGRESAFVEIMVRYREKIFGAMFALLRNYADAEEITQETFVRAHRGLAKFRRDTSLAMWLHRIAVSLSRSRYGYFFRRPRRASLSFNRSLSPHAGAVLIDMLADDPACAARASATPEFALLVDRCIERLSVPHREILTLRNCFHRSYDEIGALLGIAAGAAQNRVAQARMELRLQVGKACSINPQRGSTYTFHHA